MFAHSGNAKGVGLRTNGNHKAIVIDIKAIDFARVPIAYNGLTCNSRSFRVYGSYGRLQKVGPAIDLYIVHMMK